VQAVKAVQETQAAQGELLAHQQAVTAQTEAVAAVAAHRAQQAEMEVVRLFGRILRETLMPLVLAAAVFMAAALWGKLVALGRVVAAR
jgi:hypothetical protein